MSMLRSLGRMSVAVALVVAAVSTPAVADDVVTTTIDANSFTNPKTGDDGANDFHLIIDGMFTGAPSSDKMPNRSFTNHTDGTATADFSGGIVPTNNSLNVKFMSTGKGKPNPRGYFTKDGKGVPVSGPGSELQPLKSKALDGTDVAFVANPLGGFEVNLNLSNNFGSALVGVVQVYVNTGFFGHFNLDEFATLRNPRPVFVSQFFFQDGQAFPGIQTTLQSMDEYLLILGFVDALDGAGLFPFAIAISPGNAQSDTWTTVAPLPTARGGLAASTGPDGKIYALGGFDGSGQPVNAVERYDLTQGTWTQAANLPTARHSLGAALGADGRIYALGGFDGSGQPVNAVECYDPRTDTWTLVGFMPTPRARLAVVAGADGRIYAMGGVDGSGQATSIVESFDPISNTWARVPDMPTARAYLTASTDSAGVIHALDGLDNNNLILNKHEAYDLNSGTWQDLPPPPDPQGGSYSATSENGADGNVYIISGCTIGGVYSESCWCYNPRTGQWKKVAPLPTPRAGLASAPGGDGRIYTIGGFNDSGVLNVVEAYTPSN
jgi:hypothetical protein